MKFLDATNSVYFVDVYLMDEDYTSVEYSIIEGDLEKIKEYYLKRYSNLRTPHGIIISSIEMDYDKSVFYKENI